MRMAKNKHFLQFAVSILGIFADGSAGLFAQELPLTDYASIFQGSMASDQSCQGAALAAIVGDSNLVCDPRRFADALCGQNVGARRTPSPAGPSGAPGATGTIYNPGNYNERRMNEAIRDHLTNSPVCPPEMISQLSGSQAAQLFCKAVANLKTIAGNPSAHPNEAREYRNQLPQLRALMANPPQDGSSFLFNGGQVVYWVNGTPVPYVATGLRFAVAADYHRTSAPSPADASRINDFQNVFSNIKDAYKQEIDAQLRAVVSRLDPVRPEHLHFAEASFGALKSRIDGVRINTDSQVTARKCMAGQRNVLYIPRNSAEGSTDQLVICPAALDLPQEALAGLVARALASAIDACSMDRSYIVPNSGDSGEGGEETPGGVFLTSLQEEQRMCLIRQISDPTMSTDEATSGARHYLGKITPEERIPRNPGPHCPRQITQRDLSGDSLADFESGAKNHDEVEPRDASNVALAESWATKAIVRYSETRNSRLNDDERKKAIMEDLRKAYRPICEQDDSKADLLGFPKREKFLRNVLATDDRVRAVLGCPLAQTNSRCDLGENIARGIADYQRLPELPGMIHSFDHPRMENSPLARNAAADRALAEIEGKCRERNSEIERGIAGQCDGRLNFLADGGTHTKTYFGKKVTAACQSFCTCKTRKCYPQPVLVKMQQSLGEMTIRDGLEARRNSETEAPINRIIAEMRREDLNHLTRGGTSSIVARACRLEIPNPPSSAFSGNAVRRNEVRIERPMTFRGPVSEEPIAFTCVHNCTRSGQTSSCSATAIPEAISGPDREDALTVDPAPGSGRPILGSSAEQPISPLDLPQRAGARPGRAPARDEGSPAGRGPRDWNGYGESVRADIQQREARQEREFQAHAQEQVQRLQEFYFADGRHPVGQAYGVFETSEGNRIYYLDENGDFQSEDTTVDQGAAARRVEKIDTTEQRHRVQAMTDQRRLRGIERNHATFGRERTSQITSIAIVRDSDGDPASFRISYRGRNGTATYEAPIDSANTNFDLEGSGQFYNSDTKQFEFFRRAKIIEDDGTRYVIYTTPRGQLRRAEWEDVRESFRFTGAITRPRPPLVAPGSPASVDPLMAPVEPEWPTPDRGPPRPRGRRNRE